MKKILAFTLALMMVLSLAACGGSKTPAPSGSNTTGGTSHQEQQPDSTPDESTPPDSSSDEQPDASGLDESFKKWEDNEYSQQVPKPTIGQLFSSGVTVDADRNITGFQASVIGCPEEAFTAYTESCLSSGWSEVEGDGTFGWREMEGNQIFNAVKGDYKLAINYEPDISSGQMSILIGKA